MVVAINICFIPSSREIAPDEITKIRTEQRIYSLPQGCSKDNEEILKEGTFIWIGEVSHPVKTDKTATASCDTHEHRGKEVRKEKY